MKADWLRRVAIKILLPSFALGSLIVMCVDGYGVWQFAAFIFAALVLKIIVTNFIDEFLQ